MSMILRHRLEDSPSSDQIGHVIEATAVVERNCETDQTLEPNRPDHSTGSAQLDDDYLRDSSRRDRENERLKVTAFDDTRQRLSDRADNNSCIYVNAVFADDDNQQSLSGDECDNSYVNVDNNRCELPCKDGNNSYVNYVFSDDYNPRSRNGENMYVNAPVGKSDKGNSHLHARDVFPDDDPRNLSSRDNSHVYVNAIADDGSPIGMAGKETSNSSTNAISDDFSPKLKLPSKGPPSPSKIRWTLDSVDNPENSIEACSPKGEYGLSAIQIDTDKSEYLTSDPSLLLRVTKGEYDAPNSDDTKSYATSTATSIIDIPQAERTSLRCVKFSSNSMEIPAKPCHVCLRDSTSFPGYISPPKKRLRCERRHSILPLPRRSSMYGIHRRVSVQLPYVGDRSWIKTRIRLSGRTKAKECSLNEVSESNERTLRLSRRLRVLLWIGFITACFEKCVTGSAFVFNVYAVALKETFNYTQKEVEIISAFLNLGQGVAVIPGMFYDRFGPQSSTLIGLLLSSASYTLIWSSSRMISFYSTRSYLVILYFFLAGFGSMFPFIASLNTNIINFGESWSGRIIGIQDAFYGGGPVIFSMLYYAVFDQGLDSTEAAANSFSGFMFLLLLCHTCVHLVCLITIKVRAGPWNVSDHEINIKIPDSLDDIENDKSTADDNSRNLERSFDSAHRNIFTFGEDCENCCIKENGSGNHPISDKSQFHILDKPKTQTDHSIVLDVDSESKVTHTNSHSENTEGSTKIETKSSLFRLLRTKDYLFLAWMFMFLASVDQVTENNITTSSRALRLNDFDKYSVPSSLAASFVTSVACGILLDSFRISRIWFFLTPSIFGVISMASLMFQGQVLSVFFISHMLAASLGGLIWTTTPTEVNRRYGTKHFGRNWGFILAAESIAGTLFQYMFGYIYDESIDDVNSIYCTGLSCVQYGYLMMLIMCILCFLGCCVRATMKQLKKRVTHENA